MVRGLEIFRKYFASYQDHYVLIGGTATTLVMEEAGIEFRAASPTIVLQRPVFNGVPATRSAGPEVIAEKSHS